MRFYIYIPLIIMPFMSGCIVLDGVNNVVANTKAKYQEPQSGEIANLRAFYGDDASLSIYPNSSSLADIKKDKNGGSVQTKRYISGVMSVDFEPRSIGMPFAPKDKRLFSEYKVPANHPFIISMFYSRSELQGTYNLTTTCKKRYYKVNLQPNKNYGANVQLLNKSCSYRIFEYQNDGSEKLLTNVELIR